MTSKNKPTWLMWVPVGALIINTGLIFGSQFLNERLDPMCIPDPSSDGLNCGSVFLSLTMMFFILLELPIAVVCIIGTAIYLAWLVKQKFVKRKVESI